MRVGIECAGIGLVCPSSVRVRRHFDALDFRMACFRIKHGSLAYLRRRARLGIQRRFESLDNGLSGIRIDDGLYFTRNADAWRGCNCIRDDQAPLSIRWSIRAGAIHRE